MATRGPRMVSARELVGKRIVRFDPRATIVGPDHTVMHEPTIYLDDGSCLVFSAEEHPDGDEYGVWIGRVRVKR